MRIGRLRHTGSIEKLVKGKDDMGGAIKQWQPFSKVWCEIKPMNGDESFASHEKHATATHHVLIRYLKGVEPKMRLVSRGRVFEIKAVLNVSERDIAMRLIVEEESDHDI
jgi:SPP1 family predicted phage head-tail adaptor